MNTTPLEQAWRKARAGLLELRSPAGVWSGKLSASALSTATAVVALALARRAGALPGASTDGLIGRGLDWLAANANADGGWGDTVHSRSNLSTTTLAWAAFGVGPDGAEARQTAAEAAEAWLTRRLGKLDADAIARGILESYAEDRTFSVPILTHCALAGRLGEGPGAWRDIVPLPFELSIFPASWYAAFRLPVVSYALPALIAVGYARHHHAPSSNPLLRAARAAAANRAFRVLDSVQPPNGGFLEATPLTSFVVMSLVSSGKAGHPVARRGLEFLAKSAQPDGSWPIDTNLATWVTTLATNALGAGHGPASGEMESAQTQAWLLAQQHLERHPYTHAAPGGWAWTDLPGGVPDADDTAGALLALKSINIPNASVTRAVEAGVGWLLDLQNSDGGMPTFCRGWGKLPFDRSSADLTAHALRAWAAWRGCLPSPVQARIAAATGRAAAFLRRRQESGGAWRPLWFGNEREPDDINWTYGTSRVLLALSEAGLCGPEAARSATWLAWAQKADGGWGGGLADGPASVEETALAVESLCAALERWPGLRGELEPRIRRGVDWLARRVQDGTWTRPTPIGFYFAKLWYYEEMYPVVFTVAALGRASRALGVWEASGAPSSKAAC